jgi:hypothetical protein
MSKSRHAMRFQGFKRLKLISPVTSVGCSPKRLSRTLMQMTFADKYLADAKDSQGNNRHAGWKWGLGPSVLRI